MEKENEQDVVPSEAIHGQESMPFLCILGKSGKSAIVVVVVDDKVVVPWKVADHATQKCKLCDPEKDSNKPRSSLEDIHAVKRDRTSASTLRYRVENNAEKAEATNMT